MGGELYVHTLFGPMKGRSPGNDKIYTPDIVAKQVVDHFKPAGRILEPCIGAGAFLKALPEGTEWCEVERGRNFFDFTDKVDWIVTNPPFSKISEFMVHSMKLATNIVFLLNLPAIFTVRRIRELYRYHFGIKEILLMKQPETFVQCGRQVAAVHLQKDYRGTTRILYDNELLESYTKKSNWQKQQKRNKK